MLIALHHCPAELFLLYFSSFEAQFPATTDKKYAYFFKIYIFWIELFY